MDLILNVKLNKKLEKGDVLVYDGKEWKNISKKEFLAEMQKEVDDTKEQLKVVEDLKHKVAELRGEDDESKD